MKPYLISFVSLVHVFQPGRNFGHDTVIALAEAPRGGYTVLTYERDHARRVLRDHEPHVLYLRPETLIAPKGLAEANQWEEVAKLIHQEGLVVFPDRDTLGNLRCELVHRFGCVMIEEIAASRVKHPTIPHPTDEKKLEVLIEEYKGQNVILKREPRNGHTLFRLGWSGNRLRWCRREVHRLLDLQGWHLQRCDYRKDQGHQHCHPQGQARRNLSRRLHLPLQLTLMRIEISLCNHQKSLKRTFDTDDCGFNEIQLQALQLTSMFRDFAYFLRLPDPEFVTYDYSWNYPSAMWVDTAGFIHILRLGREPHNINSYILPKPEGVACPTPDCPAIQIRCRA